MAREFREFEGQGAAARVEAVAEEAGKKEELSSGSGEQ